MIPQLISHLADACTPGGSFLGLPTWYAYLKGTTDSNGKCLPDLSSLSDIWLIVAAVVEILLRVAAIAAFAMIIYGGIEFITSQGNADQAAKARTTLINAVIGLVIAVLAATLVTFIAGQFKG